MAACQRALLLCDTLCNDQPAVFVMTDARTSTTFQDQTSATPRAYEHTLSSEAVLDALKMILIGAPLNDVLTSIALLIEAHTPGALCSVFLLDEDGVHLRYAAAPRLSDEYRIATDGVSIGPHVGACGASAYLGQPVFVSDVLSHPHFASFRALLVQTGMRAAWSSPIISHDGKVLGTFGMLYGEVREPGPSEIQLIEDASRIAGIAIERDRSKSALAAAFEKIKNSEAELRQIVDVIPQAIVVMTPEGKAIYANRATIEYSGLSLDEVRDDGFRSRVFHPEDLQRLLEYRRKALSSPVPFENEYRLLGKDGKYRWFVIRYNPLLDENGKVVRWYATATDIDDRKRAEDRMRNETVALREEIVRSSMFEEIVGSSEALRKVLAEVSRVAPTDSTVLIQGETGTGKELIARAIHNRSKRANRAFIRVNCGAIPPSLIASELFGHEKGSFTGALQRRLGRFESADGGTIFLDEIGELPPETQVALLRILQEREFERVGGNQPISIDVRVLTATNKDLNAAVAEGTFRKDLFYRLNVFPIQMPGLRERRDDIPLLAEYLIDRFAKRVGKRITKISKKALDLLQAYHWPGNIRELQNVIERAVILSDGETFVLDETWFAPVSPKSAVPAVPLFANLVEQERDLIENALREAHGQVSGPAGAAAKLGIPRQTLESKIRKLRIDRYRFKAS
ncbi:MAG: Fis family transcriptional regulator [Acidobacteria bacterium]|nr:MAG: Fis family transcriptional regulator [Acidobacteriota bacterium]